MSTRRFGSRSAQSEGKRLNTRQMPVFIGPSAQAPPITLEYYVVGGGAGGGQGGGGAGGVSTGTFNVNNTPASPNVRITVTVGAGGAGGSRGGNTTLVSPTYTIYGVGGGSEGQVGGSGGGAGRDSGPGDNSALGFPGQGNRGGQCPGSQHGGAGGGGGNTARGGNGAAGGGSNVPERGGPGGAGTTNNWIGPTVGYAAGGGGTTQNDDQNIQPNGISSNLGQGGICPNGDRVGGRAGGPQAATMSGNVNTGGGGGGTQTGGAGLGGSGVAIVRFLDTYRATEATGNVQTFSSGGYTVYKFNGPGLINFGNPSAYG